MFVLVTVSSTTIKSSMNIPEQTYKSSTTAKKCGRIKKKWKISVFSFSFLGLPTKYLFLGTEKFVLRKKQTHAMKCRRRPVCVSACAYVCALIAEQ